MTEQVICVVTKEPVRTDRAMKSSDNQWLSSPIYLQTCAYLGKSFITALEASTIEDYYRGRRDLGYQVILALKAFKQAYSLSYTDSLAQLVREEQDISEITYKKDRLCLTAEEHIEVLNALLKRFKQTPQSLDTVEIENTGNGMNTIRGVRRLYFGEHGIKPKGEED